MAILEQLRDELPASQLRGRPLRSNLRAITLAWMFGIVSVTRIGGAGLRMYARMLGFGDFAFGVLGALPFPAAFGQIIRSVLVERTGRTTGRAARRPGDACRPATRPGLYVAAAAALAGLGGAIAWALADLNAAPLVIGPFVRNHLHGVFLMVLAARTALTAGPRLAGDTPVDIRRPR